MWQKYGLFLNYKSFSEKVLLKDTKGKMQPFHNARTP